MTWFLSVRLLLSIIIFISSPSKSSVTLSQKKVYSSQTSLIHDQDAISPRGGMQAAALPPLVPPPKGRDLRPAAYYLYASVVAPPAQNNGIFDLALPLISGISQAQLADLWHLPGGQGSP